MKTILFIIVMLHGCFCETAVYDTPPAATELPARTSRPFSDEFKWVVLVVLNSGPEFTGALVTDRWVVSAAPPGLLRRRRVAGDWATADALGAVYSGREQDERIMVEIICEKQKSCGAVIEVAPQDASLDPAKCLVMFRTRTSMIFADYVMKATIPFIPVLPPRHREQCRALWMALDPRERKLPQQYDAFLQGDDPVQRPNRKVLHPPDHEWVPTEPPASTTTTQEPLYGVRARPPLRHRWTLWAVNKGVRHVSACAPQATKPSLLCEDTWEDEEQMLTTMKGYTGRRRFGLHGAHAGGPSRCEPRARFSALLACRGKLSAVHFPGETAEDALLVEGGDPGRKRAMCDARSHIGRRLWIWLGAELEWLRSITDECLEPEFKEFQAPK